jgi:hypothetical protein
MHTHAAEGTALEGKSVSTDVEPHPFSET